MANLDQAQFCGNSADIIEKIQPHLVGNSPDIIGYVLAELTASFIAGFAPERRPHIISLQLLIVLQLLESGFSEDATEH